MNGQGVYLKHALRLSLIACLSCVFTLEQIAAQNAGDVGEINGFDEPGRAGAEFQLRALLGDLAGALQCVHGGTDEDRQMVQLYVEFATSVIDFRNRFLNVYGYEALERFNDPEIEQSTGSATASGSISIATSFEIAEMFRNIEDDTHPNRARMIVNDSNKMPLVQTENGWFVDGAGFFAELSQEQRDQTTKVMRVLSVALTNLKPLIGIDGISADDIDFELGRYTFTLSPRPPSDVPTRIDRKNIDESTDGSALYGMQRLVELESKSCVAFVERFMDENDDQWYELLHPLVQPIVDREKLQIQRRRIPARFENVEFGNSLCRVVYQENDLCRTIFGTLDSEYGQAIVRVYKLGERFVGFEIQDPEFAFSTLPIVKDFQGVSQNTWPCLDAVQSGNFGSAVNLLSSKTRDLNKRWNQRGEWIESSEGLADFLKEAKWNLTRAIDIGEQIAWPQSNENALTYEVLHTIELVDENESLKRWPSIFEYRIANNQFELNDWNFGSGEMYVAYSEFDQTITLLKAFSTGDSETIIGMLPKSQSDSIDRVLFDAFLQTLSLKLGAYEYLFQPEFTHVREFRDDTLTGKSYGWVKFEKVDSYVTLDFAQEFLLSFNFTELPNDVSEWVRKAEIKEHLIPLSRNVVEQITSGESKSLDQIDESQRITAADLIAGAGESKSIQFDSYEPLPDRQQVRIKWASEHVNGSLIFTVEYQLNAFGKFVSSLNVELATDE